MEASSDRTSGIPWLAVLGLLAAAGAAGLILLREPLLAGAAVGVAAACFIGADVRSAGPAGRRERFGTAVAERVADGVVLGALAWVSVDAQPLLAGAALAALGTAYLAGYLRAKAVGLGFRLDRIFPQDGFHFALVALGLLLGGSFLHVALWVAAGVSLLSVARDAKHVAGQAEAG